MTQLTVKRTDGRVVHMGIFPDYDSCREFARSYRPPSADCTPHLLEVTREEYDSNREAAGIMQSDPDAFRSAEQLVKLRDGAAPPVYRIAKDGTLQS